MAINAHISSNQTEHTVKDYIKQPQLIEQALTVVSERLFLAESLFTKGYNAQGGGVAYQESVNKYVDEDADPNEDFAIAEGEEFHQVYMSDVGPQRAGVRKYAIEGWITFEDEDRNQLGTLSRLTTRMMNTMVKHLDGVTLNMLLTNSKIQTINAGAAWGSLATASIWSDLFLTRQKIEDEELSGGVYVADTLVISNNTYGNLMMNQEIREMFGERDDNPVFVGSMEEIAGLRIMKSPYMSDDFAFVMQKGALGGIADEVPLTLKPPERDESRERIFLRAKRLTVAFLTDPGSIRRLDITP